MTDDAPRPSTAPDPPRSPRAPQRTARRRTAILDAARHLFAQHGIDPVTTNQIAAQAGISPGNLYYWFRSKAEIVRALFDDWSERMRIPAEQVSEPAGALRTLWDRITQTQQPDPAYAFFLRDLFPLLHTDPALAEAYRRSYTTRRDELVGVVERIIDAGLLQPPTAPTTIRDLISMLWLVSETAQPFAEAVDDARVDSQRYGRAIIEPHLTDAGRRTLHLPANADDGDHA
ncbi:TetR/AcrR family transcriptional regulator [Actinomyces viscosus]|uniref:HTH-type transcriptional repressor KstR2 n=1 Tax=Actinomyces viscosus TaxID=1656 RepID=A0A3S4VLA6_ACTVI|nr:TetR/AcrR family transcriptional regulator [Actinomyces viscosus]TFH52207.1 TetR/AcrR family transcriptional regulator [Actinomyces viscosus]VEI17724.1 HTH-type transcriptional repressor KstR2 [Actinomyces viscosus]